MWKWPGPPSILVRRQALQGSCLSDVSIPVVGQREQGSVDLELTGSEGKFMTVVVAGMAACRQAGSTGAVAESLHPYHKGAN